MKTKFDNFTLNNECEPDEVTALRAIIETQQAEITRLRGEIENLTPPAALGYVTGVYAEQTNRVHCLRRGKR